MKNNECKVDIEINGKRVSKELIQIIIERIGAMPRNIKFAVLGEILTKEDVIKEICNGTSIGKEILMIEIGYYQDLVREA